MKYYNEFIVMFIAVEWIWFSLDINHMRAKMLVSDQNFQEKNTSSKKFQVNERERDEYKICVYACIRRIDATVELMAERMARKWCIWKCLHTAIDVLNGTNEYFPDFMGEFVYLSFGSHIWPAGTIQTMWALRDFIYLPGIDDDSACCCCSGMCLFFALRLAIVLYPNYTDYCCYWIHVYCFYAVECPLNGNMRARIPLFHRGHMANSIANVTVFNDCKRLSKWSCWQKEILTFILHINLIID